METLKTSHSTVFVPRQQLLPQTPPRSRSQPLPLLLCLWYLWCLLLLLPQSGSRVRLLRLASQRMEIGIQPRSRRSPLLVTTWLSTLSTATLRSFPRALSEPLPDSLSQSLNPTFSRSKTTCLPSSSPRFRSSSPSSRSHSSRSRHSNNRRQLRRRT